MPDNPNEQPTTPAYPPEPTGIAVPPGLPPRPTSPMPPTSVGMPVGPTDPWPHTGPTELAAPVPAARSGGWGRRFWPLVLAGTSVLAVTMFLVVFLWPGGSLEFQALEPVRTVAVGDEETAPQLADLDGDKLVIAADRSGETVVFGTDVSDDGDMWEQAVPDLSGASVTTLLRYDGVVMVFGDNSSDAADPPPNRMAVLDADSGEWLWTHEYDSYDAGWYFFDEHLILIDHAAGRLAGLDPRDGSDDWTWQFPEGGAAVYPVTTEADLAGPSGIGRSHDNPRHGDRMVVIGGDGSAQVLDVGSGEVIGAPGANVADPSDEMYAYEDQLFVVSGSEGRVYRFDLTNLPAQPQILYSLTDPAAQVTDLVPCGTDRLCLQEDSSEGTSVVWVDTGAGAGGERGRAPMGEAVLDLLLPVGDRLVVETDAQTVVFDRDGAELLTHPGLPVRVDDANILVAAAEGIGFGSYEAVALTGFPLGADDPGAERTELGQAQDARADGCAWDDQLLICPTSEGAGIWRFASS